MMFADFWTNQKFDVQLPRLFKKKQHAPEVSSHNKKPAATSHRKIGSQGTLHHDSDEAIASATNTRPSFALASFEKKRVAEGIQYPLVAVKHPQFVSPKFPGICFCRCLPCYNLLYLLPRLFELHGTWFFNVKMFAKKCWSSHWSRRKNRNLTKLSQTPNSEKMFAGNKLAIYCWGKKRVFFSNTKMKLAKPESLALISVRMIFISRDPGSLGFLSIFTTSQSWKSPKKNRMAAGWCGFLWLLGKFLLNVTQLRIHRAVSKAIRIYLIKIHCFHKSRPLVRLRLWRLQERKGWMYLTWFLK